MSFWQWLHQPAEIGDVLLIALGFKVADLLWATWEARKKVTI